VILVKYENGDILKKVNNFPFSNNFHMSRILQEKGIKCSLK